MREPNLKLSIHEDAPYGWDDLVVRCPWGSFYSAKINLEIIRLATGQTIHFICARQDHKLMGGIAYAVHQGPLGAVFNCLPYFGSYGDAVIHPDAAPDTEESIYHFLLDQARSAGALCLNVITSPFADNAHHQKIKEIVKPTFVDDRVCQISHIPEYAGQTRQEYETRLHSVFEGRARTAYRKVSQAGLDLHTCQTEEEAREFFRIHKDNIGRKGGIFKLSEFFSYTLQLSRKYPEMAEIAIVTDRDRVVAGVVLFYFHKTVEYHTTCLLDEYRSIGPINQIIVEKMLQSGLAGYRFWNFGGSWKSQEGVYKFKKSFGAVDHPYYYYTVFFRDVSRVKSLTAGQIMDAYPFCFVIPFSELSQ